MIITSHVLPLASLTRDIYNFGSLAKLRSHRLHKGAFPQEEIKPPLRHPQRCKQLGSKRRKMLKFIKICMADGLLEAKEVGGL